MKATILFLILVITVAMSKQHKPYIEHFSQALQDGVYISNQYNSFLKSIHTFFVNMWRVIVPRFDGFETNSSNTGKTTLANVQNNSSDTNVTTDNQSKFIGAPSDTTHQRLLDTILAAAHGPTPSPNDNNTNIPTTLSPVHSHVHTHTETTTSVPQYSNQNQKKVQQFNKIYDAVNALKMSKLT